MIVVKVGGSLFDLPDLGLRLQGWMRRMGSCQFILVPGGGATVDAVRAWDRRHGLGDDRCHWLALRALSLNAYFLAALLPEAQVIQRLDDRHAVHALGQVPIVDMHEFARDDDGTEGYLPHSWDVTSDSLAARLALRAGADQLILLKSVSVPADMDWLDASRRGYVDAYFPEMVRRLPPGLRIRALNFR